MTVVGLIVVGLICLATLVAASESKEVPNFVGRTEGMAKQLAGNDFEIVARGAGSEPDDIILSQNPKPGERARKGSTVSVVTSQARPRAKSSRTT